MIEAARARLAACGNVDLRLGDLGELPLEDEEVDVTLTVLVLNHQEDPLAGVREMARVLRPGGWVLIVDMVPHDRQTFRHQMGHRHLGFDADEVARWAEAAGLHETRWRRLRPDTGAKGPGLFVATMHKR